MYLAIYVTVLLKVIDSMMHICFKKLFCVYVIGETVYVILMAIFSTVCNSVFIQYATILF